MKHSHWFLALVLGLGFTVAILWLLGSGISFTQAASPHHVAPNCTGVPAPCHTSLQDAVDAALPGDVILVAAGVYSDVHARAIPPGYSGPPSVSTITQVVYISKTITLSGGYTAADWVTPDPEANPTTLNAQGQGRVILIAGNISPTVEGLRITSGDAAGLGGRSSTDIGGGIYVMSATASIVENRIFNNTAAYGGGVYLQSDDATLDGNTVASNTASQRGGGLYLWDSDAALNGNTVISNTASYYGGGLLLQFDNATLDENIIVSNTASYGGGLHLWGSNATLVNNLVADNEASVYGSGLYIERSFPRLVHTTIARNQGGYSGVYVTNLSSLYSSAILTNTILVSHSVGIAVTTGSTATLESTLWYGNATDWDSAGALVTGTHNYWGDPRFAADGYHLLFGSTAIDKGVNTGVTNDIDGDPRTQAPDLGADEYVARLYLPLILRDESQQARRR